MEALQNVIQVIKPGVYMASINLKGNFYFVPVIAKHQFYLQCFVSRYLKFVFRIYMHHK